MACHPGEWDVDRSEGKICAYDVESNSNGSHDNDDGDGEPTVHWDFNGDTKQL